MDKLTIITDHKWKQFIYGYELTEKERKEFDWMDEEEIDTSNFFRYRKNVYSVNEFMRIPKGMFPKKWDGYLSDSFFSGILIRLSNDGEEYQAGLYLS
jgi:hypothetical protein